LGEDVKKDAGGANFLGLRQMRQLKRGQKTKGGGRGAFVKENQQ